MYLKMKRKRAHQKKHPTAITLVEILVFVVCSFNRDIVHGELNFAGNIDSCHEIIDVRCLS
jgi:hypothetical protein